MKIFLGLLFFLSFNLFAAFDIPRFNQAVVDEMQLLSAQEKQGLDLIISEIREQTQAQLQIWITSDTQGSSIEELAIKTVEKNALGDKQRDDGLLILVALKSREVRIEVGQGLEGTITDYLSHQIIKNILLPAFKQKEFYRGLAQSLVTIGQNIDPKFSLKKSQFKAQKAPTDSRIKLILYFSFFIMIFILSRWQQTAYGSSWRSSRRGYYGGDDNFFGGGSSGGGFSGFGGGGFSGGGSSGKW